MRLMKILIWHIWRRSWINTINSFSMITFHWIKRRVTKVLVSQKWNCHFKELILLTFWSTDLWRVWIIGDVSTKVLNKIKKIMETALNLSSPFQNLYRFLKNKSSGRLWCSAKYLQELISRASKIKFGRHTQRHPWCPKIFWVRLSIQPQATPKKQKMKLMTNQM